MDPLRTDEPLPPGFKKSQKDFESQILSGCTAFVAGSISLYFIGIWPFLTFQDIAQLKVVLQGCGFGLLPALIFGVFLCRKAGLAGACAFVAGSITVSVFLFLRMQQVFLEFEAHQAPKPTYFAALQYLLPIAFTLLCLGIALIATPKDELALK